MDRSDTGAYVREFATKRGRLPTHGSIRKMQHQVYRMLMIARCVVVARTSGGICVEPLHLRIKRSPVFLPQAAWHPSAHNLAARKIP
jgi:hypothetical protein